MLQRFAVNRAEPADSSAVLETDLRERLDQFLREFGQLRFGMGVRIESLTLLADWASVGKREGRYLAAFGTGTKMIWNVALSADGTVSFNGTIATEPSQKGLRHDRDVPCGTRHFRLDCLRSSQSH
ncbi:MAG TPA: hypothetical protein VM912_01765 [Terriglobales bacterium]|nr:hypothetical protein [Terriglobales bacterium]